MNKILTQIENTGPLLVFFLVFISLTGCERNEPQESFDCADCYQEEPSWGPLLIKITINKQNQWVPYVIYRGDIEDNNIEYSDTAYVSEFTVDVPVPGYYSVTARYNDGDLIVYAVDGDKIKVRRNATDCDEECYYFKGGYIDVRLNK